MSHVDPGPMAAYESLADPNLTGYFNNGRMRRHLRKSGLISKRGEIVSEKVFRLNNARKDHQRHIRDVLAQAIIHKALDMERHRQMSIKQQLEKISKIERVRKVRAERALRGDEDILPLLSPRHSKSRSRRKKQKGQNVHLLKTVTDGEEVEQYPQSVGYPAIPDDSPHNTRTDRMTSPYPNAEVDNQYLYGLDRDALRSFTLNLSEFDLGSGVSPYNGAPIPPSKKKKQNGKRRPATASGALGRPVSGRSNARSLQLHRKEPPMLHHSQIHTLCRVTFKYLGKMVHLDREEEDPRDTVEVMQQHCGGENLCVFKGQVMPGDNILIISRRHRTFPFSLSFYLNGVQVERLSTCCEFKHKVGYKLGARSSHFGLVKVEGSQPCFKCMVSKGKLKTRPEPTPPSSARPKLKKKRKTKQKYRDESSSDSSSNSKSAEEETEVHHDAGKDSDTSSVISSKSDSTISSVSETEDGDGEGNISSGSEDKYSFRSTDKKETSSSNSSTTSTQSIEKAIKDTGNDSDSTITSDSFKNKRKDEKPTSSSSSSSDEEDKYSSIHSSDENKDHSTDIKSNSSIDTNPKKVSVKKETKPVGGKFAAQGTSSDSSSSSSESDSDQTKKQPHESIVPYVKNKTSIDLSGKLLTNAQCDEFYSYLLRHPSSLHVEEVNLKDCRLGDTKTCQILKSFLTTKCLKVIDLSNNNLTYNSCYTILDICLGNPVEVLRLNDNPLEDKGIDVLVSGLNKSQRSANSHVMEKNTAHSLISSVIRETKKELGSEIDSQAASEKSSATSSVFHELISLNKLILENIGTSKNGMDCVVDFIKLNPKLSFLSINGNAIGKKTMNDLGNAIANNYFLKNLEMNGIKLKDDALIDFINTFKDRTTSINLSLKGNFVMLLKIIINHY